MSPPAANLAPGPAAAPPGEAEPPRAGPPAAPEGAQRFHRRVARVMAAMALAATVVLVFAVWMVGRGLMANGMRLRAEAVATSTAAAMPRAGLLFDATQWCRRVRGATTDAVLVAVKDELGREVGRDEVPEPEAGVVVAEAALPADAAVPHGSVEVRLDKTRLAGLLGLGMAVAVLTGLVLSAAVALAGGALARRMTRPIAEVAAVARRMAAGDLSARVADRASDELGQVAASIEDLGQGLARMVLELRAAAAQVAHATGAIADTSRAQVSAVAGQSAGLEETASTVAEMATASRLATESAQLVIEVAERSEKVWHEGEAAVRHGMSGLEALDQRVGAIAEAVTELSDRTVQIAGIIATVKDLAEQSNVLALNAAIEASKVGEAGQGFAVVAEEMRRLSTQSHRATDEVRAMLAQLQRATRRVVTATADGADQARVAVQGAERAAAAIGGLALAIEESSQAARGIASTTRQQTEEIERIATAMEYLHGNMAETLEGAHRIEAVARELTRVSESLAGTVGSYTT